MRHPAGVDVVAQFRRNRALSAEIFRIPTASAYYDRPIRLRHPIVFYEGHLPAFNVNTVIKLKHGLSGIDDHYETLFARGIDPENEPADPSEVWPSRDCIQKYGREADALVEPASGNDEATFTVLEHELMHHETLMYMLHELSCERKVARPPFHSATPASRAEQTERSVMIPAGQTMLGAPAGVFGWDNEFPQHRVDVDAFTIDVHDVTNGEYLEYMNQTGVAAPHFWTMRDGAWHWRAMFGLVPLPLDWPVYATHDEASAYARWRSARLPTEAEYHRAAFGSPAEAERLHPWGDEPPDPTRGNFGFAHWDPVAVGSYPAGASAWGIHDLVGNGWEWTSTVFEGFDGFVPMESYPQYSADFFDGKHYVMKGASPATAVELIRASFRNWFRPNYPYVYATFRCVTS